MQLTFLGTGSMVPTKERNVVGHFLNFANEGFLIDCGEGSQRQMNIAGINRLRIRKILITHWHGDHVGGLIGLLQTISNSENPPSIKLFGPPGTKDSVKKLLSATLHDKRFDLEVIDLDPKNIEKFYETDDYQLECAYLDHPVSVLGYRIVEKDKRRIDMNKAKKLGLKEGPLMGKIKLGETVEIDGKKIKPDEVSYIQKGKILSFVLDTSFCENCIKIAENADLLICEATYHSKLEDKAIEYKHLTAAQSAQIASNSGAKKLVLTHFSQRYPDVNDLLEEAKTIFPETITAKDFMKLSVIFK